MAVRQMLVADRYRLLEPVGAGGMGRVWLARDQMLDRDVAIKEIVPPDWMTEAEKDRLRDRTLREARSAARLNHPHVVRIYDVVRHDDQSWIVMEYIPSRSLHQVLQEEGPYDPAGAARIGLAVLDALDAAHRAAVLHRDVKPHNVLIGADGRVVLTDFGLATFLDDGTITAPGLIVGSPQYVSPERARDGASTVESDLWSLGATVYAAVEGRSPYARDTAMATLAALASDPPDPPVRSGPLTGVLEGLLRHHPADRLTAAEVEHRLRLIVAVDHREIPLVPGQRTVHHRPEEPPKPAESASPEPSPVSASPPAVSASPPAASASPPAVPASPPAEPAEPEAPSAVAIPAPAPEVIVPSPDPEPDADDDADVTTPLHYADRALVRVTPAPRTVLTGQILNRSKSRPAPARTRRAVVTGVLLLLLGGSVTAGYLAQNSHPRPRVVLPPAAVTSPSTPPSAPPRTATPSPARSAVQGALPTTALKSSVGTSPIACDAPPPAGARVTPKKHAARGVNGWTLHAGWSYFTDGTGFHIAVPDGWTYQRIGRTYCFRHPDRAVVMTLDAGRDPAADPLQACQAEDLRLKRAGHPPGYALIGISPAPLVHKAADWDYRYQAGDGSPRRASIRWFVVNGTAYALGWATPESTWTDHLSKIQMVRSTFYADRPTPPEADRG